MEPEPTIQTLVHLGPEYMEKFNAHVLEKPGEEEFIRFQEYEAAQNKLASQQRYEDMVTLRDANPQFKIARDKATEYLKQNFAILRGVPPKK